jgi:hypothetical protein
MATMPTLLATQPAACKPSVHAGRSLPCCVARSASHTAAAREGALHETFKPTVMGCAHVFRRSERAPIVATTGSNERQPPHHATTPALSGHRVGWFAVRCRRSTVAKGQRPAVFFSDSSLHFDQKKQTVKLFFQPGGGPKEDEKKPKPVAVFLLKTGPDQPIKRHKLVQQSECK